MRKKLLYRSKSHQRGLSPIGWLVVFAVTSFISYYIYEFYLAPNDSKHDAIVTTVIFYIMILAFVYFACLLDPTGYLNTHEIEIYIDRGGNIYFYKRGHRVKKDTLRDNYAIWLQIWESRFGSNSEDYVISLVQLDDFLHKQNTERITLKKFKHISTADAFREYRIRTAIQIALSNSTHKSTKEKSRQDSINFAKNRAELWGIPVIINRDNNQFFLFRPSDLPQRNGDIDLRNGTQIFPEHQIKSRTC